MTVVSGTLSGSDSSTLIGQIVYPSGYNKENCIVLGYEFKNSNADNWMMGSTFNSGNTYGSIPFKIQLIQGGISIEARNILLSTDSVTLVNTTSTIQVRLVLMKIS